MYVLAKHYRECTENTVQGEAECCICLETPPKCCIFRTHELRQCFNCYNYSIFSLVRSDSAFAEQQIVYGMKTPLAINTMIPFGACT